MVRIGYGYDAHRLSAGRECVLCGVRVPCEFGPDGHSDADVPVHALTDALLGAAALGDIGSHFPDSDARWKDADSLKMLSAVWEKIAGLGYAFGNADITIVLQEPRISPYIADMRDNVAGALGVGADCVSVKATTEEGMGFTGNGEGIASSAVVLLTVEGR